MTAITMKAIKGIPAAAMVAAVLALGTVSAQAADSNDRIVPPSPAEVAILRGLLALQHPALRQNSVATVTPVSATPTVVIEPAQPSGQQS
jgi:hypothetical protein